MKVTFLLAQFPVRSETFIIDQITNLIDMGLTVKIVSLARGVERDCGSKVVQYKLLERTEYLTCEKYTDKMMKKLGIRVLSVLRGLSNPRTIQALNLFRYGHHSKTLQLSAAVAGLNHAIKSDVVVSHFGTTGVFTCRLKQLGLIEGKLVTVFHGYELSVNKVVSKFQPEYRKLFNLNSAILPISNYWKEELIKLGCDKNKIYINRMGVDIKNFQSSQNMKELSCPVKIVTVARLVEKKGILDAISAMSILKKKGVSFEYSIIGHGPMAKEINNHIVFNSLEKEVSLLGYQPPEKINKFLHDSDIFLLPSVTARNGDKEGIPVALMEAMYKGLIVVSTHHSGIPELIQHAQSGFLVEEHSPRQISNCIEEICNNNYDVFSIKRNAREKIERSYNQDKLHMELFDLLRKISER